ncbi:MAG TPA: SprT-like domain-containing protein [Candidatus Udaeobacter sp.]|jgi:predicted SprT family Zn-dependent metalloprotease|nr:SprT-like domain-containing protein [Candidatus Udaeobacter sp.]
MPLLRQLELVFRSTSVAGIADPGRLGASLETGVTDPGYNYVERNLNLEETARELLHSLGAARIAGELRVEWNSHLKTAAGRADYRKKLISLNPRLFEHPTEIDRTFRHELAHILAQFRAARRRILPHGNEWRQACVDLGIADEKRCHNLPFPARTYAARFVYHCPNCRQEFPRVRRLRRAVACLACCRKHNGGEFDLRFRLRLQTSC